MGAKSDALVTFNLAFAKAQGIEVEDRGRVPAELS